MWHQGKPCASSGSVVGSHHLRTATMVQHPAVTLQGCLPYGLRCPTPPVRNLQRQSHLGRSVGRSVYQPERQHIQREEHSRSHCFHLYTGICMLVRPKSRLSGHRYISTHHSSRPLIPKSGQRESQLGNNLPVGLAGHWLAVLLSAGTRRPPPLQHLPARIYTCLPT